MLQLDIMQCRGLVDKRRSTVTLSRLLPIGDGHHMQVPFVKQNLIESVVE